VFDEYRRWQRELEQNPVELLGRRLPGLLAEVRARLAAAVGADPDDLVLVPNATSALNVVARSLRLERGDEVLATDHEYGAADLLWGHVCERAGSRYVRRRVPVPVGSRDEVVDAIWSGVTDRTRVLFLSHVSSATALVFPLAELCRRARAAGILTVVDGAHGPGQVPLDLSSLGADAYAGTCHKWLCAPKGAGFLWVRPELHEQVDSLVVGWGWAEEGASFVVRNEGQGTRDPAAYLAVPAALDFLTAHGWDAVRSRCHELASGARRALAELTGLAPLQPDSSEWFAQMVTAALPDECDAEALGLRLAREHGIEVYARAWNGRPVIRVSVQGYNTSADVRRLLATLPALLSA
jgi:isopenicillin-N epimerase